MGNKEYIIVGLRLISLDSSIANVTPTQPALYLNVLYINLLVLWTFPLSTRHR